MKVAIEPVIHSMKRLRSNWNVDAFAPPSVLPDISPAWGEIGSRDASLEHDDFNRSCHRDLIL